MPKDLRQFLEEYERDHPEDVITIERPISLKHEIGILVDLLDRERKFPLLRIKNPILCMLTRFFLEKPIQNWVGRAYSVFFLRQLCKQKIEEILRKMCQIEEIFEGKKNVFEPSK